MNLSPKLTFNIIKRSFCTLFGDIPTLDPSPKPDPSPLGSCIFQTCCDLPDFAHLSVLQFYFLTIRFLFSIHHIKAPNYEWFPWSICNGCGMPVGNAYPSGHLVPSPFWDLLMLKLLRPNSSNLPCLYSTFHLEYPLVLSRFCIKQLVYCISTLPSPFQDRHATGHFTPVIDASQDWFLLHGEENSFGTVLKSVRKLDTCDKDDYKITVRIKTLQSPRDGFYPTSNNFSCHTCLIECVKFPNFHT